PLGDRWHDEPQQQLAAPVQRGELQAPATRYDAQRRRAEAEIPARVPPGLFTTRAEQDARRAVEGRFQCGARSLTVDAIAGAVHVQATARAVVAGGHRLHVVLRCVLDGLWNPGWGGLLLQRGTHAGQQKRPPCCQGGLSSFPATVFRVAGRCYTSGEMLCL